MKKNTHLPLYKINFKCISCNYEYQTYSPSSCDITIKDCSNCVHPSMLNSKVKKGAVEKFHQRKEKVRLKNK